MAKKASSGGNTKVEAANAKKAAAQSVKNAKAQAQADAEEAAEWAKGSNSRGESKRQEEERKRQEAEAKKAELKRLQELEDHALAKQADKSAIKKTLKKETAKPWEAALAPVVKKSNKGSRATASPPAPSNGKVTQAMITAKKEAEAAAAAKIAADSAKGIKFDTVYGENRNRGPDVEGEARSLDAALDVLSLDEKDLMKHPEKRMKGAFKAYEEAMMPVMKEEYPGLKLSQYKQRIFDAWKKAPENPMNQASAAYNTKK